MSFGKSLLLLAIPAAVFGVVVLELFSGDPQSSSASLDVVRSAPARGGGTDPSNVEASEPVVAADSLSTGSSEHDGPTRSLVADASLMMATLRGRVFAVSGDLPPSVRVLCSDGRAVESEADGSFSLAMLEPGEHRVWAEADGLVSAATPSLRVGPGETIDGIELVLESGRHTFGCVTTTGGELVSGATVLGRVPAPCGSRGDAASPRPWFPERRTVSDADGYFRLGPFPAGQMHLEVDHAAYSARAMLCATGAEGVVIELHPARGIHGTVISAITGEPVPVTQATLLFSRGEESGPYQRVSAPIGIPSRDGAEGRFFVEVPPMAYVRVLVHTVDHEPVLSAPIRLIREITRSIELTAGGGVPLNGRVEDETGAPIAGAKLRIVAAEGAEGLVQGGPPVLLANCTSAADGRFETGPVGSGSYRIDVQRSGYRDPAATIVTVAAGQDVPPIVMRLSPTGSVWGQVKVDRSLTDGTVWIVAYRSVPGEEPAEVRAEIDSESGEGVFLFDDLVPGTYRVELRLGPPSESASVAFTTAEVTPGDQAQASIGFAD